MSSLAISSVTSSNDTQTAVAARTPGTQTKTPATVAAKVPEDTVKLSEAAQAKQMHSSGQSVSAIATALGTSVSTVDSYLGITDTALLQAAMASAKAK